MKKRIFATLLVVMSILSVCSSFVLANESVSIIPNEQVYHDNDYIAREIFGYKGGQQASSNISALDTPLAWDPEAEPVYTDAKTVGSADYQLFVFSDGSYSTTTATGTTLNTVKAITYGEKNFVWNNIGGGGSMSITVRYSVDESTGDYRITSVAKGSSVQGVAQSGNSIYYYTPGAVGISSSTVAWRKVEREVENTSTGWISELESVTYSVTLIWDSRTQNFRLVG